MIILLKFASENRYFIKELADIMLNLQQSQYTFYLTRHRNSFEYLINWHNFIVGKS